MRRRRSSIPSNSQQIHRAKYLELAAEAGRPILPGQERHGPPEDLEEKAAALWSEFMDAMPAGWFGRETYPLLRMLCRHIVTQEKIATKIDRMIESMCEDNESSPDDIKEMRAFTILLERQTKIVAYLSYQLRLTPKSRGEYRKKDVSNAPGTESQRRPWDAAACD